MKKVFYPLFAICLITASCSDEGSTKNADSMSISSCYLVKNNTAQSESFSSPVGMYILTEDGKPYEGDGIYNATYRSGTWSMNTPVFITKAGKVYSYFPYRSVDKLPELAVNMSEQTDLLYSKVASAVAPGSTALSIKLYHALSRLSVSVEGEEITEMSLESPLTCKFNIITGAFSDKTNGSVTVHSGRMLVIPHTAVATELKITLKTGKQYSYSVSGTEYRTGEDYTYQFRLNENRDKLEILSFSVEDWINDNNYNDYLR